MIFKEIDLSRDVDPDRGANFLVGVGEAEIEHFDKHVDNLRPINVPSTFVYLESRVGDRVNKTGIIPDGDENGFKAIENRANYLVQMIVDFVRSKQVRAFTIASVGENHPVAVKVGSSPDGKMDIATIKLLPLNQGVVDAIREDVVQCLGSNDNFPQEGGVIVVKGVSKKDMGNPDMR